MYSLSHHLIIRNSYQSCDASTTVSEFRGSFLGNHESSPREDQTQHSWPTEMETRQFFRWSWHSHEVMLGSVYVTKEEFENAALLENAGSSIQTARIWKRWLFILVDGKHFESWAFRKRWRHDNHVISLPRFPQTQIQTERWLLCFEIPQR